MVERFGSVERSGTVERFGRSRRFGRFVRFGRALRLRSLGFVSDRGFRDGFVRERGAKADDAVVGPVDSRVVLV
jgi:hypothetical protein